ncbi:MAG: NUDIX domain-containing protein [Actinomycetaceae bacterium]|nr:NUDIX domain-containing protein [Actinomycetaceae bacterium]
MTSEGHLAVSRARAAVSDRDLAAQDAEWTEAADGVLEREAARVVVYDRRGRVLLVRGHDIDDPAHCWWFTIGGGIGRDDFRRAAVRELGEETGIRVGHARLVGPVLVRDAVFRFLRQTRRQHEHFFLLTLRNDELAQLSPGQDLTPVEREVLDEFRWFSPGEIRRCQAAGQTVYPVDLADMVESWWKGWDGVTQYLTER